MLLLFAKYLKSMVAAIFPISNAGCVMVVREGFKRAAVLKFENDITLRSCGIFTPISLQTV